MTCNDVSVFFLDRAIALLRRFAPYLLPQAPVGRDKATSPGLATHPSGVILVLGCEVFKADTCHVLRELLKGGAWLYFLS